MMKRRTWDPAVPALALCLLGTAAVAPQDVPRFETDVDLVAVDAYVVDPSGQPVRDLVPADFKVKVDGKPRNVVSALFVEAASPTPTAAGAAGGPAPVAAPVAATRAEGRRVVLVVDRGELRAGAAHNAVSAAADFVERLGPGDQAALFSIPSGPRHDFTPDKASLLSALRKVGPAKEPFVSEFTIDLAEAMTHVHMPARSSIANRECAQYARWGEGALVQCAQRVDAEARRQVDEHQRAVQDRLHALEAITRALALVPGPKTMALVSGGFTSVLSAGGPDVINRMREIANAAAAARITLYTIYLSQRHEATSAERAREHYTREQDQEIRAEGLATLTGMQGGHMFEVMAGAGGAFQRLASETSGYYLLGLEPEKRDRDGKPHEIEVKVLRERVDVRARRRFVLNEGATRRAASRRAPVPAEPPSPVRMTTHVLRGEGEGIKVVVGAEVDGFSSGRLALSVLNLRGDVIGRLAQELTPAHGGPPRYEDTLVLPRGPYVLKAEAIDASGRRVVAERALNAELVHGVGFDASDLMLFEDGAAGKRLSSTGRVGGSVLRPYLELYVYEGLPTEDLGVTLDIVTADGRRRVSRPLSIRHGGEGLLFAEGAVDIAALPPGPYVARAIVTFGATVARRVERRFDHQPVRATSR